MNSMVTSIIFSTFVYHFIYLHPFIWGVKHRFIYFAFIFIATIVHFMVKNVKIRILATLVVVLLIYIGATIVAINQRYHSATHVGVHDSIIQTEIAGRMLLIGKNPYSSDYFGSAMEDFNYTEGEPGDINPALYHLVTMPTLLLLNSYPQTIIARGLGFFDGRVFYIAIALIFVFLLWKRFGTTEQYVGALTLLLLNPMTARYFIEGRTDLIVLFLLFASVYFLEKNSPINAGILLGIAITTKLTALLYIPFLLLVIYKKHHQLRKLIISSGIIASVLIIPFLLWDPYAFKASVLDYYTAGGIENYPITGYGLSRILLQYGFIKSAHAYFPFWIFQILVGVPLLYFLIKRQLKKNTFGQSFISYGIFLLGIWYGSHHFNDSYFAFVVQSVTLGYIMSFRCRILR